MAKTQILDYYIHFRDRETAERMQAALDAGDSTPTPTGPGGLIFIPATGKHAILRAPDGAAIEFGGMDTPAGTMTKVNVGQAPPTTGAGYIDSPWFGTSDSFQTNVQQFTRDSSWWIGGVTKFYWAGHVVYTPLPTGGATTTPPTAEASEPAKIPLRRRLYGLEVQGGNAEGAGDVGNLGSTSGNLSRDASRGIEGFGFGLRINGASPQGTVATHPAGTFTSWSRGCIRPRKYPTSAEEIYRVEHNAGSSGAGFSVDLTATGQLALYLNASSASHAFVTSTPYTLPIGEWQKLDILNFSQPSANVMTIKVYHRGVLIFEATQAIGGVEANRRIANESWGKAFVGSGSGSGAMIDFDDLVHALAPADKDITIAAWAAGTDYSVDQYARQGGKTYRAVVASGPGNGGAVTPGTNAAVWLWQVDSVDWLHGSKLIPIRPIGPGPNHGAWTGDVRQLAGTTVINSAIGPTSTTANALLECLTDAEDVISSLTDVLGVASIQVNSCSAQATAGGGTIGYQFGAAAAVDGAITQGASTDPRSFIGNATITKDLLPVGPIQLRQTKANNANSATVKNLIGVVEVICTLGPEDVILTAEEDEDDEEPAQPIPIGRTLHNAVWPRSPWAKTDYALGPVILVAGTYVGTGVATSGGIVELAFPAPPCFLYVRPLTGGNGVTLSGFAEVATHHTPGQLGVGATGIVNWRQNFDYVPASEDADQQMEFLVTIGGNNAQFNATGVTYQYVAFCDPAARFARVGAVALDTDFATPWVHPLEDAEFLPEFAFFQREDVGTTSTVNLLTKGPGNATAGASLISSGTDIANAITFALGSLSLGTGAISNGLDQYSYVLFRRADGNDHPDQAKVMALGTYTGDGAASRTIALPATGLRPLWAIGQPVTGAAAIVRDPSHTTNTSQAMNSGSTVTTGFSAGSVDGFTVGTSLNANGVVYNYLVFFASATAGNGGWGTNGTYVPVPADSAFPDDWAEPEEIDEPEEPEPGGPTGSAFDRSGDFTGTCASPTQYLANLALSRIGVTQQITALATEQSREAMSVRLAWGGVVEGVLRDFPWPIATEYSTLVLVGGTSTVPVNNDWQYAYRAPSNLAFARRIAVKGTGRKFSNDPVEFRVGSDSLGALIFCNEPTSAALPLVLEFTRKLTCPALLQADALFLHALVWRLAHELAPALGRDSKMQDKCWAYYQAMLSAATTRAANEQQHEDNGEAEWIRARG